MISAPYRPSLRPPLLSLTLMVSHKQYTVVLNLAKQLSVGIGEFGYVNACACIKFKLGSFNNFIQSKNFAEDSRHVILAPM